jgi:hypothetical protein
MIKRLALVTITATCIGMWLNSPWAAFAFVFGLELFQEVR